MQIIQNFYWLIYLFYWYDTWTVRPFPKITVTPFTLITTALM